MLRFKISITNGKCSAPSLIVEVENQVNAEKKAISKAQELSGLGRFDNWNFSIDKQLYNTTKSKSFNVVRQ